MKTNNLLATIHTFIATHNLLPHGSTIILGLSGGPDSVFLLHVLSKYKHSKIIAAHLDHEWRPDSSRDVFFCKDMAHSLDIPCISRKLSDLGLSFKFNGSQEEIGRKARRHFFQTLREEHNATHIALAHHAQDQQETFFIRLLRGSSLTGLTGMYPQDGFYIRPLLPIDKKDILAYLHEHSIPYITDPSNSSDSYLRNRIRMQVIPALHSADARFDGNFLTTITRLQETEDYLQKHTEEVFVSMVSTQTEHVLVHIPTFLALHPIMRHRIVLHWLCLEKVPFPCTESFFNEMIRFLETIESKEHQIHPSWILVKKKELAFIKH